MELKLTKKPLNVTIIEGFPGFGLVGTIATEFLIEHLECEKIGEYWFEELPPTIAIHDGKVISPIGIFYNKKYNLVIIHSISGATGIEYFAADIVKQIADTLKCKELISLEGVGSATPSQDSQVFYYTTGGNGPRLEKAGLKQLKEGIIMGVTGSLLLKLKKNFTAMFAETHSQLPDSQAAARVIEKLDSYIGLKVDTAPLIEQAKKFEQKIKTLMEQSQQAEQTSEKKKLSYVG